MEEDFFDLGGGGLLAVKLLEEVSKVCGRDLRPTTICEAPTILDLAALLAKPPLPTLLPLVPMKAGAEKPPVFLMHGIGGSVINFVPLARRLQGNRPVYGLEARGNDGREEPFERLEEMAQYSLDAVKQLQPNGPYVFIGYSLGGMVMLEMAQRLRANGEEVAMLAMLDSFPHPRHLSGGQRARLLMRKLGRRVSTLTKSPKRARGKREAGSSTRSADLAWTRYRPRFYPGRIEFFAAETVTYFPNDPAAVWGKLAGEFASESVPGDHVGMVTTHVDSLAGALSRRLEESLRGAEAHLDTLERRSPVQRGA